MFLAHPLYLIGLLAVAVPIVVHLFDLRRYRKVYFSNVDLLEVLQQATRQESRLRRRLLLASRIAAIVFLVLAFANPSINRDGEALQPGTTAVSVYIDNSFSMLQRSSDGHLLECAKRKATEIAQAYSPADRFQLLTNDMRGEEFHWLDRDDFLTAVDEVRISPNSVPLSRVVQRQQRFLHDASADNRRAYLISDFQRSTSDIESLDDSLLSAAHSTFIPLKATTVDNIYLDTLTFAAPSFRVGDHVELSVHLRNASDRTLEQVPLHLYVHGRRRAQSTATLPPHGETVVPMRFVIDHGGAVEGFVATADSPVTFDDTLFFAFNVAQRIAVLEVYGTQPNSYLHRLFAADTAVGYRSVAVGEAAAVLSSSESCDWVVLTGVDAPSSLLTQILHDYVRRGGTLTVVAPDKADRNAYAALLQPLHAPLLDVRKQGDLRLSYIDVDHALYRSVFSTRPKEAEMPRFHSWYQLKPTAATVAQNLLTLPSGDAVLTAFYPTAQRPCYLFAAPLNMAATDLVGQSLFVPTFYNMALFSRPLQPPYHLIAPDAPPVELPAAIAPPARLTGRYGIGAEEGSEVCMPNIVVVGGSSRMVASNLVSLAGCYRLSAPDVAAPLSLAFNYTRQESVMEFLSADALPQVKGHTATLTATQPVALHVGHARSLAHLCLWLALTMLLAEVLILKVRIKKSDKTN
ncbi:MAG: BatA and WFA domain-containing protein [Bacteroidales bacterium]|nr:BatA and WFA domain-containing protein [Bacteroidales bacterium]